jgi:hypothetical protein
MRQPLPKPQGRRLPWDAQLAHFKQSDSAAGGEIVFENDLVSDAVGTGRKGDIWKGGRSCRLEYAGPFQKKGSERRSL